MGEPATEINLMDSAKASRGLDFRLKNAMQAVVDPLGARFYWGNLMYQRGCIGTDIQLCVINILIKGH